MTKAKKYGQICWKGKQVNLVTKRFKKSSFGFYGDNENNKQY